MSNYFHLAPKAFGAGGRNAQRQPGGRDVGEEIRESSEAKAEWLVLEEFKKLGWGREELGKRRKGDAQKLRIALRLRQETTMTLSWIAQRLEMGTKTHLSHLLYWQGRGKK